jgi:hypothetical protein
MAAHGGSVQLDGAAFTARMPLVGRE